MLLNAATVECTQSSTTAQNKLKNYSQQPLNFVGSNPIFGVISMAWVIEKDGNARNTEDGKRIWRYKEEGRYGDPDRYIVTAGIPLAYIDTCKTDEEARESIKHIVEQINSNAMPAWFYRYVYTEEELRNGV